MLFHLSGRADWRALTGAVLTGAGLGLGLGAAFLVAGMGGHAAEYARSEQLRTAAAYAYAPEHETFGQSVMRLMRPTPARVLNADAPRPSRAAELECLTEAVYYEARGESPRGQFAVAQVVMNRVRHPAFPKTVCGVVFQGAKRRGCQFSFACDGSMRGAREASAWTRARRVAARALAGAAIGEIGSATHFHTTGVAPAWGPQMRRVAQVGVHVFYRFAPRKPGAPAIAPHTPLGSIPALAAPVVLTSGPAPDAELTLTPAVVEAPAAAASVPPAQDPGAVEAKPAAPSAGPGEAAALKAPAPAAEVAS